MKIVRGSRRLMRQASPALQPPHHEGVGALHKLPLPQMERSFSREINGPSMEMNGSSKMPSLDVQ